MSVVFLRAKRPGRLPQSPPKDDPAWAYVLSDTAQSECKPIPTRETKLLRAHRIAAEVRDRRGMKVMKTVIATWTADDA